MIDLLGCPDVWISPAGSTQSPKHIRGFPMSNDSNLSECVIRGALQTEIDHLLTDKYHRQALDSELLPLNVCG